MKQILASCVVLMTVFAAAPAAKASTIFTATLTGAQETPGNASTATGFGMVVLNTAEDQITVDESWSGLSAPASASHIHSPGALGVAGPVLFPFAGVPAVMAGAIPEQMFAITAAQVTMLKGGLMYFNVHDANFPAGEIRGQIVAAATAAPEPASFCLIGLGIAALGVIRRRRA